MKNYFIITPNNDLKYIGEFNEFKDAWEYLEYDTNQRFVWLISERSIRKLYSQFEDVLGRTNGV